MVTKGLTLIFPTTLNNLLTSDISVNQSMNVQKRSSRGVLKESCNLGQNI